MKFSFTTLHFHKGNVFTVSFPEFTFCIQATVFSVVMTTLHLSLWKHFAFFSSIQYLIGHGQKVCFAQVWSHCCETEWLGLLKESLAEILAKVILIEIYKSGIQQNLMAVHTKGNCVRIGNGFYRIGLKWFNIELDWNYVYRNQLLSNKGDPSSESQGSD